MENDELRNVVKSVKFTSTEVAKIESQFLANEKFGNFAKRKLLRITPPRKFDFMQSQFFKLTDEVLANVGSREIDLEVLKKLQQIQNLLEEFRGD